MQSQAKPKLSQKTIYIVAGIIAAVSILGTVFYTLNNRSESKKSDSSSSSNSSSSQESSKSQPTQSAKTLLSQGEFVGKFTGRNSSLLTTALVFPNSSMEITQNNSFKFTASDLDLSLLGLESLKVNGVFPKVYVTIDGNLSANNDDKSFNLNATNLSLDFKVGENSIDETSKKTLVESLGKLGLVVPEISPQKPTVLNADMVMMAGSIKISNTKSSALVVNFDGKKSS